MKSFAIRFCCFWLVVALLFPMLQQNASQPVEAVSAQTATIPIGSTVEIIDPNLYLRSAPGFGSTVLAQMALGTRGTVLAGPSWVDNVPWYQIRTNNYGTGWASGKYLWIVAYPAATSTPAPNVNFPIGATVEIIDPNLYLRSGPGINSTVLARMALGTRGTVLQGPVQQDGHPWYQIRTASYGTGWASGKYLRLATPAVVTPIPTPKPPTPISTAIPTGTFPIGSIVEVIDPNLYLRSAPGFSSTVLAHMALGTQGTVLAGPRSADGHFWYQIRTGMYGTGWASGKYLRLASSGSGLLIRPTDGLSRVITKGVSGRAQVALTFDAGDDRGYAQQILDLLKTNGIHASFGITGAWAKANPDLIRRMVDEGHQILNHTWNHRSFTGFSASPALISATDRATELTTTANYIYNLTGYRVTPFWRPPYGDIDTSVRRDAFDTGYYLTIMWSIDSMGWNGASVSQILTRCAYGATAGDIVLMHVGADSNDAAALQSTIDILKNRGYSLVTIDQLLR